MLTWCGRGEKLSIKASGDFKEQVGEGSKMHLQVKYGLITLINQERDACDTIEQADLKCPLKKGELSLTKDVDLPREIPPVRHPVLCWCRDDWWLGCVLTWLHDRAPTPSLQMCTPRTATRLPASLRRLLSTGNCLFSSPPLGPKVSLQQQQQQQQRQRQQQDSR